MGPSPVHLLIVLLVILLLFGATRLGDLGKGLGEGVRNFKKGLAGDKEDEEAKKLEGKGGSKKES
jgi:sec-independent protein translocase protein TatA